MNLLNKFRPNKTLKVEEEILEHISDLLNTKKGFGSFRADFGLDSYFYAASSSQIIKQIMHDIKECIEKFEQRIEVLDIVSMPCETKTALSFVLKCKIKHLPKTLQLSFNHQKNLFNLEVKNDTQTK